MHDGDVPDDAALIVRARGGDIEAYERLVRRHAPLAHRTALLLGADSEASDVVQEAFVRAWHSLPRLDETASFRAWLLTIVADETHGRQRWRRRGLALAVRLASLEPDEPQEPASDAVFLEAERRRVLLEALDRLAPRMRDVVVCRYLLELSLEEAAAMLGIPQSTARSRLARALRSLEAMLAGTSAAADAPDVWASTGAAGRSGERHG